MLKLFEVKGFKNFSEMLTFDFAEVRDYKFNGSCIHNGFLGKSIVYGQNTSGKTNLGLALFDIVSHLTSNNVTPGLYNYYLNVDSNCKRAEFHYVFSFDNGIIDYSYGKSEIDKLVYEKLLIDGEEIFEYDKDSKIKNFSGLHNLLPTLNLSFRADESLLRYAITNSALGDEHPLYKMYDFVSKMLWFRSLDENRYIGYKMKSDDYFEFIFEGNTLSEFEFFLKSAGINQKLVALKGSDNKMRLYFDKETPIPFFGTASNGTKALYTLFYWKKTAVDVSFMFIDEFDAFYHFELSETVVELIAGMENTQVVLTSHNTNLLSNKIMRPDCYFILSNGKLVSFANATKRELREGHNLEKLYMSGDFNG